MISKACFSFQSLASDIYIYVCVCDFVSDVCCASETEEAIIRWNSEDCISYCRIIMISLGLLTEKNGLLAAVFERLSTFYLVWRSRIYFSFQKL